MTATTDLLRLTRHGETPPGGFTYFVPETGTTIPAGRIPHTNLRELLLAVSAHYHANHLTPPSNLAALVEDACCRRLGPDWCVTSTGVEWTKNANLPTFGLASLRQFTQTMISWWKDASFTTVPEETINARAKVCFSCPMHGYPSDCSACSSAQIVSLVGSLMVGQRLPVDNQLKACRACSCALTAKVRIPTAVIVKHMPRTQLDALPAHCWIVATPQVGSETPPAL